jgi:hypothetical protein
MKGAFHILLKASLLFLFTLFVESSKAFVALPHSNTHQQTIAQKRAAVPDAPVAFFFSASDEFDSQDADIPDFDDQPEDSFVASDIYHFTATFAKRSIKNETEAPPARACVAIVPRYILFHSLIIPS